MDTESRPVGPDEHKARARSLYAPGETDRWGHPKTASLEDVCALTPENDPFYCGRPHDWLWARWFAALWDEHGPADGVRNHLRRFHYRLFTLNVPLADGRAYTADPGNSWVLLNNASRYARYLDLVDPEQMDDRRNPGLVRLAPDTVSEPAAGLDGEASAWLPHMALPDLAVRLPSLDAPQAQEPEISLPGITVTGYDGGIAAQPVLLEVWIEKSTMDDVLVPACRELGVNLVRGQGFLSITNVCMLLRRAEAAGRDCHVLYISDYDLSGTAMPRSVARQLEFWRERLGAEVTVTLEPVALSADQVRRYGLPSAPDSGNVELDALEAIVPGELARLVRDAVGGWRDPDLDGRIRWAAHRAQQIATAQWQRELAAVRADTGAAAERYRQAEARFRGAAAEFTRKAAVLLAPLRDQVRAVNDAIGELAARYQAAEDDANQAIAELDGELENLDGEVRDAFGEADFALPAQPAGELDLVVYEGVLLDTRRGWLDQVNSYREHKGQQSLQVTGGNGRLGRAPAPAVIPPPGPDRDALAATLRAGHWTRAEVADLMGCSPANVGKMTARAAGTVS